MRIFWNPMQTSRDWLTNGNCNVELWRKNARVTKRLLKRKCKKLFLWSKTSHIWDYNLRSLNPKRNSFKNYCKSLRNKQKKWKGHLNRSCKRWKDRRTNGWMNVLCGDNNLSKSKQYNPTNLYFSRKFKISETPLP